MTLATPGKVRNLSVVSEVKDIEQYGSSALVPTYLLCTSLLQLARALTRVVILNVATDNTAQTVYGQDRKGFISHLNN